MKKIALVGGYLIDGTGREPLVNSLVLVEGKKITYAGPAKQISPEYEQIDINGKTIMPGLIDTHLHFSGNLTDDDTEWVLEDRVQKTVVAVQQAHECLENGLTTVGEISYSGLAIRNMVEKGVMQGPRVVGTGLGFCRTCGHGDSHKLPIWYNEQSHPWAERVDGPWELRKAVRKRLRENPDAIKIWSTGGGIWRWDQKLDQHYTFEERYAALLRYHDASWINIWSATSAYYHALRGETDKIPEIFSQHRLSDINLLAPGKPMMEMIENQVYLAQGAYAKVIGRSEGLLALCEGMHYALVALHVRLQTASAYERLGKRREAETLLAQALADAAPDGIVMPFAENYRYLKPLLAAGTQTALTARVLALGEAGERRQSGTVRPAAFAALTEREYALVGLMAQRLTNREIAEKLFLSEGSVKQYVNQIYSKLHIEGDQRTKRRRLAELLTQKS